MTMPVVQPIAVPVLPATDTRLSWRAIGSWIQTAGASLVVIILAVSQMQTTLAPLIPVRWAYVGGVIFAIGNLVQAVQHQKDLAAAKAVVVVHPEGDVALGK
jgi:hypothetical protein